MSNRGIGKETIRAQLPIPWPALLKARATYAPEILIAQSKQSKQTKQNET